MLTTCKSCVAALPAVPSHWGSNKRKYQQLASLLCSYMAGIWSCFCAWNLNSCPWIKWLWNRVWKKCSSEHCKYCHFPDCNVHSSTMQWECVSVQGVHVGTGNRWRVSLYRIHGTIRKFLTYTGTPLQSMSGWVTATLSFKAFHHLASGSAAIHL